MPVAVEEHTATRQQQRATPSEQSTATDVPDGDASADTAAPQRHEQERHDDGQAQPRSSSSKHHHSQTHHTSQGACAERGEGGDGTRHRTDRRRTLVTVSIIVAVLAVLIGIAGHQASQVRPAAVGRGRPLRCMLLC
jgi:hypothetical protein